MKRTDKLAIAPFGNRASAGFPYQTPVSTGGRASCPQYEFTALYLHELKGDRQGTWSVRVSGKWRVTFQFDGTDAVAVDYEDYH
ncbi:MAG: type II toxin-antitoxin system RelE/ParE family toxin [Caldilineaceae bacterium]|nr:type II toxin-antitoxin system RelE/ParE family toxin [Caldilineaceae bacterium]